MYLQTEQMLEILHRAQSAERESLNNSKSVAVANKEDRDVPYIPPPPVSSNNRVFIPQTAVFRDGVFVSWYFAQNGRLMKRNKSSLDKSCLLREFVRGTTSGYVALLICTKHGSDGMTCTQSQALDEAGFNQVVKSYYSIRLTGIIQEYQVTYL
jgi:hypothetical protein